MIKTQQHFNDQVRKNPTGLNKKSVHELVSFDTLASSEPSSGLAAASLQLQQMFAGGPGNAIAVAASQAIAATQQLTGRRTSR